MTEEYERVLANLLRQEDLLQFETFTNDDAYALGTRLVETARREGKAVAVDITRNGQQLFHAALPGTSADNNDWIARKNRVVSRFGHSSFYMGQYYASKGSTLEEQRADLAPAEYAAHGGAFPVIVRGVGVVGTVTVSGLPQQDDHELVTRVIAEYLGVSLADGQD